MLILNRRCGEEILIGDNVRVVVGRIAGSRVAIGIAAPEEIRVMRAEIRPASDACEDPEAAAV